MAFSSMRPMQMPQFGQQSWNPTGFRSNPPPFDVDEMIGKRISQFMPADHRWEREDDDGRRIEISKNNAEIMVMAEPIEKKGAFKLAKKDRVVAGYWLSSDDLDKTKARILRIERAINLRGTDEHFDDTMECIELANRRHQGQQHEYLDEFLRRRKYEQQVQLKARLERRIQNLGVGASYGQNHQSDENVPMEGMEGGDDDPCGLQSVKGGGKGIVKSNNVVDRDAPLRALIGLKIRHPDTGVDGQIVHCFNPNSNDVFVVVTFQNQPQMMATEPLQNLVQNLKEHNDLDTVTAMLKAIEDLVNNPVRGPFQQRQNIIDSAFGNVPTSC